MRLTCISLQRCAVSVLPEDCALWEICDERRSRCFQMTRALAFQGQDDTCAILPPLNLRQECIA